MGLQQNGEKEEKEDSTFSHFSTLSIHAGNDPDRWYCNPIVAPISLSVNFKQSAPGQYQAFDYSRAGNPTRQHLEETIATLDGNKYAICLSSGCAAITAVTYLLNAGDHIICMDGVYGGTSRYMNKFLKRHGIEIDYVQATVLDNVTDAIKPNTKLIWLETPTNPTLNIVDLEAIVKLTREKTKDAYVVVDNTFMSPYFQRPSDFGVDMVVQSCTKYINGHADVLMGSVSTSNQQLYERLQYILKSFGGCPSPFDCYLVIRGIKTLALRMKQHMSNGLALAKFLDSHPAVESVNHPGLPSHPQYELGRRQMSGYSGMLSFYIKGGLAESKKFLKDLKLFSIAESYGGHESLVQLPAAMTHASVPEEQRKILGVTDNLIRVSVGLEDICDIIADIDQALKAAVQL